MRWYGPTPTDSDIVFMERKVHREDPSFALSHLLAPSHAFSQVRIRVGGAPVRGHAPSSLITIGLGHALLFLEA